MNAKSYFSQKISLILVLLACTTSTQAKVTLPSVFSDYMVFQQKTNAAIWGKTKPGLSVNITTTWSSKAYSARADQDGNWKILVPTPSYGGPYTVTISDGEETKLSNVLIGDVWVCSGQSNMEMPLAGWGKIDNYEKEIQEANYPKIRLLQGDHVTSNVPLANAKVSNGGWVPCTPQYIGGFSSVAYFFAREIYKKTGIPIGLIHTSWGGTIAEAWTSAGTLKKMPDFAAAVDKIEKAGQGATGLSLEQQMEEWQKLVLKNDAGYVNGVAQWTSTLPESPSWKTMTLPVLWEKSGIPGFDGVMWFRKSINIPASWAGKEIKLNLGTIDDDDVTYFNGEKIGETKGYNATRIYTIPAAKVKAGANVLAVRIFDGIGDGGIYGDQNILSLTNAAGGRISLDGEWTYNKGLDLKDIAAAPVSNEGPNRATVLYNAMINPYIQFAIRGAIWYQGESNADRASQYKELFPNMIRDWRSSWKQPDFPFYFVQLANFMKVIERPGPSAWAELRDAQLKTLSLPNTGMAVAIDIGDAVDIHPKNKQEVGRRLALIALAKDYGIKTAYSGPQFQTQQTEGSAIKLTFKFAEGGLKAKDGTELKGFTIAGADQKFYTAKATIKGNQVIVSSTEVTGPVAVRYAWADNPVCNLVNGADLPASPFRTDSWKEITYGKK
ncbi:sialate O-acetylesterase [Pedobacter metabolipauper]|nr:sialate O-acetylesterase [Pedobacter metabolipauper]